MHRSPFCQHHFTGQEPEPPAALCKFVEVRSRACMGVRCCDYFHRSHVLSLHATHSPSIRPSAHLSPQLSQYGSSLAMSSRQSYISSAVRYELGLSRTTISSLPGSPSMLILPSSALNSASRSVVTSIVIVLIPGSNILLLDWLLHDNCQHLIVLLLHYE